MVKSFSHDIVYLNLLKDVLENGEPTDDRTGVGTLSVFGRQIRFNLAEGFPLLTTKKIYWKAVVSELLWFIEGSSDERRLAAILYGDEKSSSGKSTIWTENAQSPYWKHKALFPGDLGKIYGVQWRSWGMSGLDQLGVLIEGIRKDPNGRRHILTSWNPEELDSMALPPCHILAQFSVKKDKLCCSMYQRSVDTFLGLPFNIASYALLTHLIAQICELEVGDLIMSLGDVHIYKNHIDVVKEQLTRDPYPSCSISIDPCVRNIDDFTMGDIQLINYTSHGPLKAAMAV